MVRNINVRVEEEVYAAAKVAAAKCGMLFRKWVERAIADAAGVRAAGTKLKGPTYEPVD
jgi:predicted HicB family RNase H-like nuclease